MGNGSPGAQVTGGCECLTQDLRTELGSSTKAVLAPTTWVSLKIRIHVAHASLKLTMDPNIAL